MPYLSTIERWAIERGKKEGKKEGEQEGERRGLRKGRLQAIELGLDLRFGASALALVPQLREVEDSRRLRSLLSAVRRARTLEAFAAKLRR